MSGRAARVVVVLVAAGAGVGFAYKPGVHANLFPKNFGEVDAGKVYRAGQLSPAQLEAVRDRHGIKTVIDLGSFEPGEAGEARNRRAAAALGLERYVLDLEGDATGNPNWYVHALSIMTDPAKQPVLVHCGAGSERTGCAVILYDALVHNRGIDEGYEGAGRYGHDPRRNPRLREVLDRHGAEILNAVVDGGQVPGVEAVPAPTPGR